MKKIRPDSKDAIIEAAFQVFSETPTAGLGDVAERAGVGRATLHRHFTGRTELMRALAKTAFQELDQAVEEATANAETYTEGFRLSFHAVIPLATRQWFLAHEDFEEDLEISQAYSLSQNHLLEEIDAAKAAGEFDAQMPTLWIAEAYENLIYAAWSLVRAGEATPKQAANFAWRTFAGGVTGEPK